MHLIKSDKQRTLLINNFVKENAPPYGGAFQSRNNGVTPMESTSMDSERLGLKDKFSSLDINFDINKLSLQALFLIVIQVQKLYQMRFTRLGFVK